MASLQSENRCAVDGCERLAKTRGWCNTHYERWRLGREVNMAGDLRKKPPKPCAVEGCDTRATARGWCEKHYARWQTYGDPTFMLRPTYGSKRREKHKGYIDIWAPTHPLARSDGYVYEHRMVAWDAGILTNPELTVHHINHVTSDNRPENLMAVSRSEHMSRFHIGETVKNQYGDWPVLHGEARIARRRELWRAAAKRRQKKLTG